MKRRDLCQPWSKITFKVLEIAQNNGTVTNDVAFSRSFYVTMLSYLYSNLINVKELSRISLTRCTRVKELSLSKGQVFQVTLIIHHVIVVVGKIKYARSNK